MTNVTKWMSWEGGVDLAAVTSPDLQMPNLIIHLGRMVNTPVGNAASGMILCTPFEQAPTLNAKIDIEISATSAVSKCQVGEYLFEVEFRDFSEPYLISREPAAMSPFTQQGVEIHAKKVVVKINGEVIDIIVPPVGITGGPASVVSPNGVYAR